ncbi:MAG: transcription termination factor NusA [Rikenellaceae bacterium]
MDNLNLISNFAEFKELKNIDKSTMIGVLEDVFRHALQKQYEVDENFDVIINPEKGDLEIWRNRLVVEDGEVENPNVQISVSDVKAIDDSYELGDEYTDEIKLSQFGRRAVLSLRQNLASRILDLEKAVLYDKYSQRVGEIITGEVYQVWKKEVLILDDDENELILPKAEQIPNDYYRKGDTIKAIVKAVEMNNNQPRIILSRTANQFLERLFEQEVPEIFDGLITIKAIARIPGERAKVAVESYDERIDPVGACVGMKGSRIYTVVKELRNENIDVVNYTTNIQLLIQRTLNPAKVSSITLDEERKTASVYLKPDQVSLAIGKGGLNIRLSKMLTGYDIDVYREVEEEDVALTEFSDEIDAWIIEALKSVGCDTAKSVIELPVEEIAARADLEIEQAQKVVDILRAEFEPEVDSE